MAARRHGTASGSLSPRHGTETHRRFWSLALAVAALGIIIGATCGEAQTNLGLAARNIAATGRWVVFLADESAQSVPPPACDFNGDGDCTDQVPYIYDTVAGTTTHLNLAANSFKVAGNFAAFAVSESGSGGQDFNGDTDTDDTVLFVYDLTAATGDTGTATNTGQAVQDYEMDGQHVVFTTSEAHQRADLNNDGDQKDWVVQVWDLATSGLTNTGLAARFFAFAGDWVAIHVSELQQGNKDLNGDDDTRDAVLHLYQMSTNTSINLAVAVTGSRISPEACIFTVSERGQFGMDLNGDGDIFDKVVQIYVFATSQLYTPNIAAYGRTALAVGHTYAAFSASERNTGPGGTDFNGDGDTKDAVLHIVNLSTGSVTNLATSNQAASTAYRSIVDINNDNIDDFVVFVTSEKTDGFTDYNNDGDTRDLIVRAYDLSSGTFTNIASVIHDWKRRTESLGVGTFGQKFYEVSGSRVVFLTSEAFQGGTDLNLDGDASDAVVQVYDLVTQTLVSTRLAAQHYEVRGDLIGISTREAAQFGVDQNGDGDARDYVLNIYDMSGGLPGVRTAVPIAITPTGRLRQGLAVTPTFVAYRASEAGQGHTDLNADTDTSDTVVGFVAP